MDNHCLILSDNGKTFYGIKDLSITHITIPEGITGIGRNAFHELGALETIDLPSSITTIHRFAFPFPFTLKSIHFHTEDPNTIDIHERAFYGGYYGRCCLYVPKDSLQAYKQHPILGRFANIEIEK